MKNIFFLLLIPIMVLGQPIEQLKNSFDSLDFEMDIAFHDELEKESNVPDIKKDDPSLSLITDIPVQYFEAIYQFTKMESIAIERPIPIYLSTFSMSGLYPEKNHAQQPQKRLNNLIALNDPEFPKENTLSQDLNPIRYKRNSFGGAENMPEGFGLKIRL